MTDDQKKMLTEKLLGECWHSFKSSMYLCFPDRCLDCAKLITSLEHRTFTTPDDMMAVKRKLVEKGEWKGFYMFCRDKFDDTPEPIINGYYEDFTDWLLDESRFCRLVAEFM